MKNTKAIAAFLTAKLSAELAIISTSNALKQWQHGDNAPVIDTLQALTGTTYPKRKPDQSTDEYRAALVQALKTALGADAIKARLHALGEVLAKCDKNADFEALASAVPTLIKFHIDECKAARAAKKAEKQTEAVTVAPSTNASDNAPDNVPSVPVNAPITALEVIATIKAGAFSVADLEAIMQAIAEMPATV